MTNLKEKLTNEVKEEQKKVFLKDSLGKKVFLSTKAGQDYTRDIVDLLMGKKGGSISVMQPEVGDNTKSRDSVADVVVKYVFEDNSRIYVNIEINNYHTNISEVKNLSYIIYLLRKSIPHGKDNKLDDGTKFEEIIPVVQINLNSFDISPNKPLVIQSEIVSTDADFNQYNFIKIFDVSLAKVANISYNEIVKAPRGSLEYLLYPLVCRDEEFLNKLYEGDEKMEKIVKVIKDLSNDFRPSDFLSYEDVENASLFELGQNKGIEIGKTEGIEIGVVKTMLEYNASIEDIIKKTGLTEEEILKINESI